VGGFGGSGGLLSWEGCGGQEGRCGGGMGSGGPALAETDGASSVGTWDGGNAVERAACGLEGPAVTFCAAVVGRGSAGGSHPFAEGRPWALSQVGHAWEGSWTSEGGEGAGREVPSPASSSVAAGSGP